MDGKTNMDRLAVLELEIKELQQEYRGLISRGASIARQLGLRLMEARSLIHPAHKWSKYCVTQLDMVPATAYRYIVIAKAWNRIERYATFPNLTVVQMFDVARGRHPRTRSYKIRDQSLDVILDILDERLAEAIFDVPELEKLMDAINEARPAMEKHGLLDSQVEARKLRVREQRLKKRGPAASV